MSNTLLLILITCLLLAVFPIITCQKQKIHLGKQSCPLDSPRTEPILLGTRLPFCSEYKEWSCCDDKEALAIQKTVNELMRKECPSCYRMVAEWKCAQCHPRAGTFYHGQFASIKFCSDYCKKIFEVCKDIPFDLSRKPFYLNEPNDITADEWCRDQIAPEGQCFRGWMPSDQLTEADLQCKCPEHKCHIALQKQLPTQKKPKRKRKTKKRTFVSDTHRVPNKQHDHEDENDNEEILL
jgi:hypothetical protein